MCIYLGGESSFSPKSHWWEEFGVLVVAWCPAVLPGARRYHYCPSSTVGAAGRGWELVKVECDLMLLDAHEEIGITDGRCRDGPMCV